jgi:hypothetical protein
MSISSRLLGPDLDLATQRAPKESIFLFSKIVVPLMVMDQYAIVETFINKNHECLLQFMKLIDEFCDLNFHLKDYSK